MAKSYEQKMKAFKATCTNMAQMITNTAKFQIAQENAVEAGKAAAASARYAFHGFPELRVEEEMVMVIDPSCFTVWNGDTARMQRGGTVGS